MNFILKAFPNYLKGHGLRNFSGDAPTKPNILFILQQSLKSWIHPCCLCLKKRVVGSRPPSDLSQEVLEENLPALCNSRQKVKRGQKVWSYREERPGLRCSISLLIQLAPFALHINQYLTKIFSITRLLKL